MKPLKERTESGVAINVSFGKTMNYKVSDAWWNQWRDNINCLRVYGSRAYMVAAQIANAQYVIALALEKVEERRTQL